MLEDSASHVREKVIRSVGIVLETDVALLGDENVQAAVERRLSDGAISVLTPPHPPSCVVLWDPLARPAVGSDGWRPPSSTRPDQASEIPLVRMWLVWRSPREGLCVQRGVVAISRDLLLR